MSEDLINVVEREMPYAHHRDFSQTRPFSQSPDGRAPVGWPNRALLKPQNIDKPRPGGFGVYGTRVGSLGIRDTRAAGRTPGGGDDGDAEFVMKTVHFREVQDTPKAPA